jgi:homoprotocatechuate degradation regulator HpaR
MTMRDFSRSLPMLLLRSHQAVMAQFRPVLRRHGITEQQWRVLRALSSVDEARITRLAEMTLISKPSLSRLLPALEARRLVRRSAAADDLRRAVHHDVAQAQSIAWIKATLIASQQSSQRQQHAQRDLLAIQQRREQHREGGVEVEDQAFQ